MFEKKVLKIQTWHNYYYGKNAKDLKLLNEGDTVVLQTDKRKWKSGVIRKVRNDKPRAYQVKSYKVSQLERNSSFLRRVTANFKD